MALISLAGIAAAIDNLHLNEATLKGKLLQAIRTRFADEESLDTVTHIDPLDLIQELWAPKTAAEIKAKRKNLSSLKSSINKSLKEGIESGANPEGIIIGRDNVFVISDEKKNLLLNKLTLDGAGGSASLLGALAAIQDMLSGIVKPGDKTEALKILDQLDSTRNILTKLAGLAEEGSDGGESSGPGEDGDHIPVEEFEIDEDTVIEFIDEDDLASPEHEGESPAAGDAPGDGAASAALADTETLDKEDTGKSGSHIQPGEEESDQGPGAGVAGPGQAGSSDLPAGEGLAGAASAGEDDWDSFEVIDDDFDIIDAEDLAGQADDSERDAEAVGDIDDVLEEETELADELEQIEEIETEEVELEEDVEEIDEAGLGEPAIATDFPGDGEDTLSGPEQEGEFPAAGGAPGDGAASAALADTGTLAEAGKSGSHIQPGEKESGQGPGGGVADLGQAGSGNLPAGEGLAGAASAGEDDWDSFEVIDDDFDIIDAEDLAGQADDSERDAEAVGDIDDVLEEETELAEELEQIEEIETEEVELEEDVEEIDEADLGEPAIATDFPGDGEDALSGPEHKGESPAAGGAPGDGADSAALADTGTLAEAGKSGSHNQPGEEESGQGPGAGIAGPGQAGSGDLPAGEGLGGDASAEEDDWDSYEVVDDNLNFPDTPDLQDNQESASPPPRLDRSLDLSQYIEPEEALVYNPDILQEHNDEYVRQIVERFMPKFIKIHAGLYPVGGKKKRKTDRIATTVSLVDFYIGQLPITNDLFDFFVRETGYVTEAEKLGYGLVTSGRLRSLQQETGRHTLAISKGVITRQIRGANWRHPDGPGSSLENRSHHPVVQVSRLDAMAFAAWAGKRLPSEDEWESAARGKEGYIFPWGNEFLPLANVEGQQAGSPLPVNYFGRESLSPFGLLDMLGNVFEWTSSTYSSQNGRELYVLKGGSWATARITCADRLIEPATTWSNTIGFRCAVDAD